MFRADALAAHSRRATHTRVMAMAAGRPWRASPTRASLPEALQLWYTQWSEARLEEAAHSARRHSRAHVAEQARCSPPKKNAGPTLTLIAICGAPGERWQ